MLLLTKLARMAVVALAAAGVVMPATSVAAARTICVGLVVDARTLGGPVSAGCTTVADGSTGYDVLRAAGHTVGFRQDGLVCAIDNRPADGCASTDASHYWAYFHRAPHSSSWAYSNEGPSTYTPGNGETEGWVWRDNDSAKPQSVPYSSICPQQSASVSPSASPRATRTAAAHTVQPPSRAAATRRAPRRSAHAGTTTTSAPTSAPAPAPSRSAATVAAVTSAHDNGSSGPPWGLLVGTAAVVSLGGVASVRWRRRAVE